MFFSKYSASGNDFLITYFFGKGYKNCEGTACESFCEQDLIIDSIENDDSNKIDFSKIAPKICHRQNGIGADGLIVIRPNNDKIALEYIAKFAQDSIKNSTFKNSTQNTNQIESKIEQNHAQIAISSDLEKLQNLAQNVDFIWEFYNSDGSLAAMCGNGSRAAVAFVKDFGLFGEKMKFLSGAGIICASVFKDSIVEIKLTPPKILKQKILEFNLEWDLIDTGVPHLVCAFSSAEQMQNFSLENLRTLRSKYNANVNIFYLDRIESSAKNIESDLQNSKKIVKIATFERGVEGITLACGTGICASFVFLKSRNLIKKEQDFCPPSGEILSVRSENNELFFKGKVQKIADFFYEI